MKDNRRPPQQQVPSDPAPKGPSLSADAYIVRGLKHKHGWRKGSGKLQGWGKRQWAETAYHQLKKQTERVSHAVSLHRMDQGTQIALTEEINAFLRENEPGYKLGKIDRLTVLHAAGIRKS